MRPVVPGCLAIIIKPDTTATGLIFQVIRHMEAGHCKGRWLIDMRPGDYGTGKGMKGICVEERHLMRIDDPDNAKELKKKALTADAL